MNSYSFYAVFGAVLPCKSFLFLSRGLIIIYHAALFFRRRRRFFGVAVSVAADSNALLPRICKMTSPLSVTGATGSGCGAGCWVLVAVVPRAG